MKQFWAVWLRVWRYLLPEMRHLRTIECQRMALRRVGYCTFRSVRYWVVFGSLIAAFMMIDRIAGVTPLIQRANVPGLGFLVWLLIGSLFLPFLHWLVLPVQRAALRGFLRERGIAVCMRCGAELPDDTEGRCGQCGDAPAVRIAGAGDRTTS